MLFKCQHILVSAALLSLYKIAESTPSLCIHSAAVGEAASGTSQAFLAGKSKPSELLLKTLFNNER